MQILITIGSKTVGKELSKAAARIVIGVGCEVATFVIAEKIKAKIKEAKEAKNEEVTENPDLVVKAEGA